MVPSPGHTSGSMGEFFKNSNWWAIRHTDLFPKAPHVILEHKVLNLFIYLFFSLGLCLKNLSHELHQNQFQSF